MRPKGYFIFHLNLAFSSIEKSSWQTVIDKCYWPILDIISDLDVPIGIELTGWTLNNINNICPEWVDKFKLLLEEEKCELIGSGYCQIIAPLVPYELNIQNQIIGMNLYKQILGFRPKLALVNEMAYSDSVVDLLYEAGYLGLIMDRDNIQMALDIENEHISKMPLYAKGVNESELPILWADSILFQKLQHISHRNISIDDYVNFIKKNLNNECFLFPLYSNDAETFDFRPGRFKEEPEEIKSSEWQIIRNVIKVLSNDLGFEFISPSKALYFQNIGQNKKSQFLASAAYPVPVKKQPKYNIARWAVTGRDDTWLNTMCFRIFDKLNKSNDTNHKEWKTLCELWSSDFRTHITDKRWLECKEKVQKVIRENNIDEFFYIKDKKTAPLELSEILKSSGFKYKFFGDGIYFELESKSIKAVFNLRRGMAIESLSFKTHNGNSCIGTIKHGYLDSIEQGADYYSGGLVMELPESRTKITDLNPVEPIFELTEENNLIIKTSVNTSIGSLVKHIELSATSEKIELTYKMSNIKRFISSVKLANLTLTPIFSRNLESYACQVGGNKNRIFDVDKDINQSEAVSRFVSSSKGFSSTSGKLKLKCLNDELYLSWNNSDCSPLCFIDHKGDYTRVAFSICEFDESSKESNNYGDFRFTISPKEILK